MISLLFHAAPPASAGTSGGMERRLCAAAAAQSELTNRLPAKLLQAMTRVESGRWPWAVRARGIAHMLPNRAAAVALVERLRRQGVQDVIVGCLQVNLRYHRKAFATIEDAFEPATNAAYAGRFLQTLYRGGSWWDAVGRYQGGGADARRIYVAKVVRAWLRVGGKPARRAIAGAIVDAAFDPAVDGVLDMTPFTDLGLARGKIRPDRLAAQVATAAP
jgi:hypothetical protein